MLPLPIEKVFEFFSKAENLQAITPPELHFKIITPLPITMGQGTLIDYKIKLSGVPFGWRTRMDDEVLYKLPLWPLGEVAYPFVKGRVSEIFQYRRKAIKKLLGV